MEVCQYVSLSFQAEKNRATLYAYQQFHYDCRALIKAKLPNVSYSRSSWNSMIVDHPNQRDGHNCGLIVLGVILQNRSCVASPKMLGGKAISGGKCLILGE